jgi:hypothetical protein
MMAGQVRLDANGALQDGIVASRDLQDNLPAPGSQTIELPLKPHLLF